MKQVVELAARQTSDGGILILLDADDDCPKQLAGALLQRARSARSDREIRVVIAKHENVSQLVNNGWVHLFAIEDDGATILRHIDGGGWEEVDL